MLSDKTTLRDLSIFPVDGGNGVFALINRTTTQAGADALRKHVLQPPATYEHLCQVQAAVKFWAEHLKEWPTEISNGTLVMLDKFFDSADSAAPPPGGVAGWLSVLFQKTLNKSEYFFTKFSVSHLSDLLKGCQRLLLLQALPQLPALMADELKLIAEDLNHPLADALLAVTDKTNYTDLARLQYEARRVLKKRILRLISSYARIDAWQSMARAGQEHQWHFATLLAEQPVALHATGMYHPLLASPICYDIALGGKQNFMLLTGANMSGKTTFLRTLGVCTLLAHLGMAVPAATFECSFVYGIVTNMHTEDNILRGESYFFAEVQRMKHIAAKLATSKPHLTLMDELFKGTNVHDACECTRAVVEGLLHKQNHLMALSTHLYEVAQQFGSDDRIQFKYFVTTMNGDGRYTFNYLLKDGISNDRIGYLILQQEGVIDLLQPNK